MSHNQQYTTTRPWKTTLVYVVGSLSGGFQNEKSGFRDSFKMCVCIFLKKKGKGGKVEKYIFMLCTEESLGLVWGKG